MNEKTVQSNLPTIQIAVDKEEASCLIRHALDNLFQRVKELELNAERVVHDYEIPNPYQKYESSRQRAWTAIAYLDHLIDEFYPFFGHCDVSQKKENEQ